MLYFTDEVLSPGYRSGVWLAPAFAEAPFDIWNASMPVALISMFASMRLVDYRVIGIMSPFHSTYGGFIVANRPAYFDFISVS